MARCSRSLAWLLASMSALACASAGARGKGGYKAPATSTSEPICDVAGDDGSGRCAGLASASDEDQQDLMLLQRRAREQAADVGIARRAADFHGAEAESSRRRRGGRGRGSGGGGAGPAPASSEDVTPTSSELKTFAGVVDRLWKIDARYRLQSGRGYRLSVQNRAASLKSGKDTCPAKLFTSVNEQQLEATPCAKQFISLLDNYERDTSVADKPTAEGHREETAFVGCLMQTPHMKYVYNVLVKWGSITVDYTAFSKRVSRMWFTAYSLRSRGPLSSSGFEHTFVGEEKMDKRSHKSVIIGMHNWIQFWREEKLGRINYLGYVGDMQGDHVMSARFSWQDDDPELEEKTVSTFLVGSSVPFEMAMLTCGFFGFHGEAKIRGLYFGNEGPLQFTAYKWDSHGETLVRTAYLQG